MESSTLVKLGLFGAAGYLGYRYLFAAPAKTPFVPFVTVSPGRSAVSSPALDAVFQKMVAAASAAGVPAAGTNSDGWNVYLVQAGGPNPAPVPEDVFGSAIAGDKRQLPMTASEYWSKMAPYLASKGGFTGLGFFGELCCGRAR